MGKTSNAVKQRWNASHYTQVKLSVKPEIAKAFKAACQTADISMAGELERHMRLYIDTDGQFNEKRTVMDTPPKTPSNRRSEPPDSEPMAVSVRTLNDRRKAITLVCNLIERLIDSEAEYMDSMPVNFQQGERYTLAEERLERLEAALDDLELIY